MKETIESFKTPIWLAGAVIAAWGVWVMRRKKKNKKTQIADKISESY